jgi:hypothetical protein|tara:strand:+ start:75 stop:179 length:105 start_codon:yes stop_codon:yes gene_type:complete
LPTLTLTGLSILPSFLAVRAAVAVLVAVVVVLVA